MRINKKLLVIPIVALFIIGMIFVISFRETELPENGLPEVDLYDRSIDLNIHNDWSGAVTWTSSYTGLYPGSSIERGDYVRLIDSQSGWTATARNKFDSVSMGELTFDIKWGSTSYKIYFFLCSGSTNIISIIKEANYIIFTDSGGTSYNIMIRDTEWHSYKITFDVDNEECNLIVHGNIIAEIGKFGNSNIDSVLLQTSKGNSVGHTTQIKFWSFLCT